VAKRTSDEMVNVGVKFPAKDLTSLATLATLDTDCDGLGKQIRRAVTEYIARRTPDIKARKVVGSGEMNVRRNLKIITKPNPKG